VNISPRIVTDPPPFSARIPPPKLLEPRPFRELYIESFEFTDLSKTVASPFYTISALIRLNSFCWNEIIAAIREEDKRINGVSDTSVGHAEEIKKAQSVVERGGSLGWKGKDEPITIQMKGALGEDYAHLVDQTDWLWKNRERRADIRQKNSETRWTTLTNAFTYLYAPLLPACLIFGANSD
jgi:hypothetical protein